MPVLVPHAALATRLGAHRIESQARTVGELLEEAGRGVDPEVWKRALRCTLLLNGRNIHYLRGRATPLGAEDVLWMVVPSGGG